MRLGCRVDQEAREIPPKKPKRSLSSHLGRREGEEPVRKDFAELEVNTIVDKPRTPTERPGCARKEYEARASVEQLELKAGTARRG